MLGALNQIAASQGINQATSSSQPIMAACANNALTVDPLRELVLESLVQTHNPERLSILAAHAANLPETEEIKVPCDNSATSSVKNLAGIFTGTDNFVKKIEEKVKKRFSALECSDSESFGGK